MGQQGAGGSPAVADGLGEETQVLVDLQAVLESKDCFLIVLEDGQSVSEHHLGHSRGFRWGTGSGRYCLERNSETLGRWFLAG